MTPPDEPQVGSPAWAKVEMNLARAYVGLMIAVHVLPIAIAFVAASRGAHLLAWIAVSPILLKEAHVARLFLAQQRERVRKVRLDVLAGREPSNDELP